MKLARTPDTTLRRRPQRGSYDIDSIYAILDEALLCHVGFVRGAQVVVLPSTYARSGDTLYLHGAVSNATLCAALSGARVCVTVTLLDGLVLARSQFHHSMNYRSVVLFGVARDVTDAQEKERALAAIVEHVAPGRSREARAANATELAATRVIALRIEEASAKVRQGPPIDDAEDLDYQTWAGVIPLRLRADAPERAPELASHCWTSEAARKRGLEQRWPCRTEQRGELVLTTELARVDVATVHRHLRDSYWAHDRPLDVFERALRESLCVAVIRPDAGDQVIGFARVVGDGVTFAYLMDVFVITEYRGRGIGRWLVEFLRSAPELAGVRRFMLGTRDAHSFYERAGFQRISQPELWMEIVQPYPSA